jgi:hypothetical protein
MSAGASEWRPVPIPDVSDSYEINEDLVVRSVERTIIRCNGSPYRVRERLLKPTLHRRSEVRYVRLATGRRGRYRTLYLNRRTLEQVFGAAADHQPLEAA